MHIIDMVIIPFTGMVSDRCDMCMKTFINVSVFYRCKVKEKFCIDKIKLIKIAVLFIVPVRG